MKRRRLQESLEASSEEEQSPTAVDLSLDFWLDDNDNIINSQNFQSAQRANQTNGDETPDDDLQGVDGESEQEVESRSGTSDVLEREMVEDTPKRRPGRPKGSKKKRPVSPVTGNASGNELAAPVVKRGRGRPKKVRPEPSAESLLHSTAENQDPPVIRRKRGRPRKITRDDSASTHNDVFEDSGATIKRGRGRPKGTTNKVRLAKMFGWSVANEEELDNDSGETPVKRGRGRPKGSRNRPKPGSLSLLSTPARYLETALQRTTPASKLTEATAAFSTDNADRSARRKSARTIMEQTLEGDRSDNEDDAIMDQIYDPGLEATAHDESLAGSVPPVKRGRGRPKGSKNRIRTPSPIRDLPAHEQWLSQNRPGGIRTSNNTMSQLKLLDHEEFFKLVKTLKETHKDDIAFLQELHERSFNQWQFELSQGFNVCAYGWGSKRLLLMKFAEHISRAEDFRENHKIVIINGYVGSTSMRDILNTIAAALSIQDQRLGSQPAEMLENICSILSAIPSQRITLIIHSIDSPALRRSATQTLLSRLSSHAQISVVASADHPSFPLLWDSSLRLTYNFLCHDCTTFQTYGTEVDAVNDAYELLGRGNRRIGGREGVSFVLKSLPENAKNLFRVLVAEQLVTMVEDGGYGSAQEDEENFLGAGDRQRDVSGVEYRVLYQKATEEFICGNEVAFRTLLKEFHDHQMIQSKKDILGTEILTAPFRKEELESILEDLTA